MKQIKYILAILMLALTFHACEMIGSIDKIQPDYKLLDDNVISDDKSAEAGINGVYASWKTDDIGWMRHLLDMLTGSGSEVNVIGNNGFSSNSVETTNEFIDRNYRALYFVVQNSSLFLQNLNANETVPGLSKERKAEMEGEATYSRAQALLFLLRQYGEFFDTGSKYGIVLPPEGKPISDNTPIKRSTVEESYKQILADLDNAIAKAPAKNVHYKVSKTTAKALKARVLLYMKDFAGASALAKEVLAEAAGAGYALEENFNQMFENSFESSEMLFAIHSVYPDETYGWGMWGQYSPGANSTKIANNIISGETDKRFIDVFEPDEGREWITNKKYPFEEYTHGKQASHFYIRLAEMYYIVAETQTRLGNTQGARDALKEIIAIPRAGYTPEYVDNIADNQLLTAILHHKWMEFTSENNEEWFDLVRYHAWDKFVITTKDKTKISYVASDVHLLLPIPRVARRGNLALEQNPGYEDKEGN